MKDYLLKEYLPTTKAEGNKTTVLKVTLTYQKGGTNMFTGTGERRGYSLSVVPVQIEDMGAYKTESFMLFNNKGLRTFLLEVKKQSPKSEAEALRLAMAKKPYLIADVLAASGLTLAAAQAQAA